MTPLDRTRAQVGTAVIAVVAAMMVWTNREMEKPPPPSAHALPTRAPEQTPQKSEEDRDAATVASDAPPAPSTIASAPAPPPAVAPQLIPAERSVDDPAELEEVHGALRDFRTALGENPVGTNAEITRALLGDNLKQLKLPLPHGSRLNAEGELCDRWGTPYFFHQVSGKQMEVRSAGPDRRMWTADDRQR